MYQKLKDNSDSFVTETFKNESLSSFMAYYEFNLFIGGYISYLKINNIDIYDELMSNSNLWKAYTKIDSKFGKIAKLIELEFKNDDFLIEISENNLNSTKKDLQQFLPELENLKVKMIANNINK
jgi:hypothetical protein